MVSKRVLLLSIFCLFFVYHMYGDNSGWKLSTSELLLDAKKERDHYSNLAVQLYSVYDQLEAKNSSLQNEQDKFVISLILSYCYDKLDGHKRKWKWAKIHIANFKNIPLRLNFISDNYIKNDILEYRAKLYRYYDAFGSVRVSNKLEIIILN